MPLYISLARWTQKGVEQVKQSPSRLDKVKEVVRAAGGEVKAFYLTLGPYDFVVVFEMPDDETYVRTVLSILSQGNVQTETLKAFDEQTYRKLISSLS